MFQLIDELLKRKVPPFHILYFFLRREQEQHRGLAGRT
ncbi:MAG: hypothetical protein H5T74_09730 [Actinobacteria bacterium]|nr:hypothetical protein [Actinomycetota bacterium]